MQFSLWFNLLGSCIDGHRIESKFSLNCLLPEVINTLQISVIVGQPYYVSGGFVLSHIVGYRPNLKYSHVCYCCRC